MKEMERFEESDAWKRARELAAAVYEATAAEGFSADCRLRDEMRTQAVSMVADLAEAIESTGEFGYRQLKSVKGANARLQAILVVSMDNKLLDRETFNRIDLLAQGLRQQVVAMMQKSPVSDRDKNGTDRRVFENPQTPKFKPRKDRLRDGTGPGNFNARGRTEEKDARRRKERFGGGFPPRADRGKRSS
jgi:four helix bundle protein